MDQNPNEPPQVALDDASPVRRAAVAFVLVTVTLDALSLGVIIPVLPKLVVQFLGGDMVQAAHIYGLFGTVWALAQFVSSPVLGALSDRFGRRPVILLSNFGLSLDYVLMALAPTLGWLFVGRVISGITAASFSTAGAYIADVSPPARRAAGFGMIGAAFGVGFVLGPAVGGLLGGMDPRLPFWVAAAFSLANASYGLFVLPESLPPERRSRLSFRRANPLGSLSLLRRHRELFGLAAASFLGNLAHTSLPSVFVLYSTYRYGWDESAVGLTLAAVGVCSALMQGVLVRPAVARFGERPVLLAGLLCGSLGFAVYGLASTGAAFWVGIPIMALWGFAAPAAQGLMTRRVEATEQGQLQGALASLIGIAGMAGPGLFSLTFARFIDAGRGPVIPGAPFLLAAALVFGGFVVAALATGRSRSLRQTPT